MGGLLQLYYTSVLEVAVNPVMLSHAMASSGTPKVCSAKMTMQGTAGDDNRNTRQKKEGQRKYAPDIAPY